MTITLPGLKSIQFDEHRVRFFDMIRDIIMHVTGQTQPDVSVLSQG